MDEIITSTYIEVISDFPIELNRNVIYKAHVSSGSVYDKDAGFKFSMDNVPFEAFNTSCYAKLSTNKVRCDLEKNKSFKFTYKPTKEDYGKRLIIDFIKDSSELWGRGTTILNSTIRVTRQPTYLKMRISLKVPSPYVDKAPQDLDLTPPIFLDGSVAQVDCETDGALPPTPINFSVACLPLSPARIEYYRRSRARPTFFSYQPSTSGDAPKELEALLTHYNALAILRRALILTKDNLTLTASLEIDHSAHNCILICRLMGKEQQTQLTVYHHSSLAFFLPPLLEGEMLAGSSISCHADGFPLPSISLRLFEPYRRLEGSQLEGLESAPEFSHHALTTTSSPDPFSLLTGLEAGSDVGEGRFGLRPNEYSIENAEFALRPNATPGVEWILLCTARNALPHAEHFLGQNATTTIVRFTVKGLSYNSLGVVLAICLAVLVVALLVIAAMVMLRMRQKYAAEAIQTRSGPAVNGTMESRGDYQKPTEYSVKLQEMRSSLLESSPGGCQAVSSFAPTSSLEAIYAVPGEEKRCLTLRNQSPAWSSDQGREASVEYAQLTFAPHRRPPALSSAASMTLFRPPTRAIRGISGLSVPQNLDEATGPAVQYSEIVAVIRPKEHSGQLVLEQQHQATHALLAMHQNKPSVCV